MKSWRSPLTGFVIGGLVGMTLLTVNLVGASDVQSDGLGGAGPNLEVLHTPPLLVDRGERVPLAFEVVCRFREPEAGEQLLPSTMCSPTGDLYVRAAGDMQFAKVSLEVNERRLTALLPQRYTAGAGFDYYAEVENGLGDLATLPPGGLNAPQHAWTVSDWTSIDLGVHSFGHTRPPDETVAAAGWGNADKDVGLSGGFDSARIGPSAFDVLPGGSVLVLDQVNRRLARYGKAGALGHISIPFAGGEGDLSVESDGTMYVLDSGGSAATPIVRSLDPSGRAVTATSLAEPSADMIRVGPRGALVHSYPSEQWLAAGTSTAPLARFGQVRNARPARAVLGSLEMVIRAFPNEARLAVVQGERVVNAWRIRSSTSLGEIQIAELDAGVSPQLWMSGGRPVVAVLRIWTEEQSEFQVLQLTPKGLVGEFAVTPYEWADSASLSVFRFRQGVLYQMRSDPSGFKVVAFRIDRRTR